MLRPVSLTRFGGQGGNGIHLSAFLNRHPAKGLNLHEVWDTFLIQSKFRDLERYAEAIRTGLTKSVLAGYVKERDTVKWLEESHALSMAHAYVDTGGRSLKNGEKLGQDYVTRNLPVVEKQLAKAGVRLAALLDEVVK